MTTFASEDRADVQTSEPTSENYDRYDFRAIEAKWQRRWEETGLFRVENHSDKPKFYGLDFFPYPSGAGISVGHCRNYVPLDVACRLKVMQGHNVLHPMGWDAFGQPAENEAIKRGRNPKEMVPEYAANYKRQLKLVGISYDWSREINSSRPITTNGRNGCSCCCTSAAWRTAPAPPSTGVPSTRPCWRTRKSSTGGAGGAERWSKNATFRNGFSRSPIMPSACCPAWRRAMARRHQKHAARMDRAQRRRGSGLSVVEESETKTEKQLEADPYRFYHSRFHHASRYPVGRDVYGAGPGTSPGGADHHAGTADAVREYKERAQRATEIERQSTERTKTGVFTGAYADNPVTGEPIPIWIADYVLMGYGTGAIMAVPAHDQRDFEFARKYDIPVVLVYKTDEAQTAEAMTEALPTGGVMAAFTPSAERPGRNRLSVCRTAQQQRDRRHDHSLDGGKGRRQGRRQLPPARLADFAAAILGRSHSHYSLRDVRRRSGSRRPTARAAAGRGKVSADGNG